MLSTSGFFVFASWSLQELKLFWLLKSSWRFLPRLIAKSASVQQLWVQVKKKKKKTSFRENEYFEDRFLWKTIYNTMLSETVLLLHAQWYTAIITNITNKQKKYGCMCAIYIYIYIYISSSSSYRAGSTDIPDPLSPLLPIVHRPRQVFRTTLYPHTAAECTFVLVVLLLRGRVWGSIRVISYEFISASPAMSNLNRFRDRGQVAVQGLVEDCILV